ncbi:hypothetical protein ES702_07569 [subsurface metagenome]
MINGEAQWAKTAVSGNNNTLFNGTYTFTNILLIKYNPEGVAQWAATVSDASDISKFNSLAADGQGNVYAAGLLDGTVTTNFGNNVTVTAPYNLNNILLVKYDSGGITQWAKTVISATGFSWFYGIAISDNANIYGVESTNVSGTYDFGNDVTAAGISSNNIIVVKYQ